MYITYTLIIILQFCGRVGHKRRTNPLNVMHLIDTITVRTKVVI